MAEAASSPPLPRRFTRKPSPGSVQADGSLLIRGAKSLLPRSTAHIAIRDKGFPLRGGKQGPGGVPARRPGASARRLRRGPPRHFRGAVAGRERLSRRHGAFGWQRPGMPSSLLRSPKYSFRRSDPGMRSVSAAQGVAAGDIHFSHGSVVAHHDDHIMLQPLFYWVSARSRPILGNMEGLPGKRTPLGRGEAAGGRLGLRDDQPGERASPV